MATIEFLFDFSAMERLQAAMEEMPDILEKEFTEAMNETVTEWHSDFAEYPEPPTYPINWDSDLQRRAFFASDGFGGGIPHQRQGTLSDSWQQEITSSPGLLRGQTYSIEEWAKFVQDDNFQSNIHQGRWLNTVQKELSKTHDAVQQKFLNAINRAVERVKSRIG